MDRSPLLNSLFALLLFVAHLNCVVEHQLFAQVHGAPLHRVDSVNDLLPISDAPSDDSCHDAGCICKGATLAHHFVLTDLDSIVNLCFLISLAQSYLQPKALEIASQFRHTAKHSAPSLRALERCAILQSFQI